MGRRRADLRSAHRRSTQTISGCRSPTATSFAPAIRGAPKRSIARRLTASAKIGNVEGEILARSNLRNFLFPKGRADDAARETARVAELGRSVNDPLLKARAWTLEATQVQDSGGDLGRRVPLLKRTEAAIFPERARTA